MSVNMIEGLADALIEAPDGAVEGGFLVRVVSANDSTDQLEVGFRPLEDHPAAELEGFRAPASWVALGLVVGGWAAPLDGVRPSAHPEAKRVTHVILIDRQGRVASRIRYPDGSVLSEPPGVGVVLGVLRAALGLPAASGP